MSNGTEAELNGLELGAEGELLDRLLLTPSGDGRTAGLPAAQDLEFAIERELTQADLAQLQAGVRSRSLQPTIHRLTALTHRHHLAARLIADGEPTSAVAYATHYAPGSISALRADPAFKELVAYYAQQKQAAYLNVHERLGSLGMAAVDKLVERVEHLDRLGEDDAADQHQALQRAVMPTRTLQEIAELALERSIAPAKRGPGPTSPLADIGGGLVVNLNFTDPKAAGQGPIVDVQATVVEPQSGDS